MLNALLSKTKKISIRPDAGCRQAILGHIRVKGRNFRGFAVFDTFRETFCPVRESFYLSKKISKMVKNGLPTVRIWLDRDFF